jgi:hypothetical protein
MTVCRWIQSACPWDAHHVAVLLLYPTSPIKQTHTQGWFPQFSHSYELKISLYRSHDYMYLSLPRHVQPHKLSISQFYFAAVRCLFLGPIYTPWHFTPLICITCPVGRLPRLIRDGKGIPTRPGALLSVGQWWPPNLTAATLWVDCHTLQCWRRKLLPSS